METSKTEDINITLTADEVIDLVLAKHPELEYLRDHHMVMHANHTHERLTADGVQTHSILSLHWQRRV